MSNALLYYTTIKSIPNDTQPVAQLGAPKKETNKKNDNKQAAKQVASAPVATTQQSSNLPSPLLYYMTIKQIPNNGDSAVQQVQPKSNNSKNTKAEKKVEQKQESKPAPVPVAESKAEENRELAVEPVAADDSAAKAEEERKAKEEAERKEEADKLAKEEEDRKAKEEAERSKEIDEFVLVDNDEPKPVVTKLVDIDLSTIADYSPEPKQPEPREEVVAPTKGRLDHGHAKHKSTVGSRRDKTMKRSSSRHIIPTPPPIRKVEIVDEEQEEQQEQPQTRPAFVPKGGVAMFPGFNPAAALSGLKNAKSAVAKKIEEESDKIKGKGVGVFPGGFNPMAGLAGLKKTQPKSTETQTQSSEEQEGEAKPVFPVLRKTASLQPPKTEEKKEEESQPANPFGAVLRKTQPKE